MLFAERVGLEAVGVTGLIFVVENLALRGNADVGVEIEDGWRCFG